MKIKLPADYIEYIETDGISEGFTEGEPGYFQLWPPDEIQSMNRSLQVQENAPGYIGFGSDGGGELLAFDKAGAVFKLPMVGMSAEDAIRIADSWAQISKRVHK